MRGFGNLFAQRREDAKIFPHPVRPELVEGLSGFCGVEKEKNEASRLRANQISTTVPL
jgi:hypothetical protein